MDSRYAIIFILSNDEILTDLIKNDLNKEDFTSVFVCKSLPELHTNRNQVVPEIVIIDTQLFQLDLKTELLQFSVPNEFPIIAITHPEADLHEIELPDDCPFEIIYTGEHFTKKIRKSIRRLLREWKLLQQFKQTNLKLIESENYYRMLIDASVDGFWDWQILDRKFVYSDGLYKLLEFPNYSHQKVPLELKNYVYIEDQGKFEKFLQAIKEGIDSDVNLEIRVVTCTLRIKWMSIKGKIIEKDDIGKGLRVIGSFLDISERKRAEEELIRAKEKAEESDRLKTAFLCNISHEIRTPMNGIIGFAEMLTMPGIDDERKIAYSEIIQQSCDQLLHIINDIIEISKIEAGQTQINLVKCRIADIFLQTIDFFKPMASKKNLQFLVSVPEGLEAIQIMTDEMKFMQVLSNILSNAIKFTEKGSIEAGFTQSKEYLTFFIKDTGIGINPDKLDLIFERFRQAEENLSRTYGGTGLGLSISKAYTELLGGNIWAESIVSKGSTFYFTVPYKQKLEQTTSIKVNTDSLNLDNFVILVAEDNEINFEYLNSLLQKWDAKIIRANNGAEAVAHAKQNMPDLILMDIKMPVMNGIEAMKEIRRINADVPIIAITAYAYQEERHHLIGMGFSEYLSKPLRSKDLLQIIQKVL